MVSLLTAGIKNRWMLYLYVNLRWLYFYPVFLSNEIISLNLVKFSDLKNELEHVGPAIYFEFHFLRNFDSFMINNGLDFFLFLLNHL